MPYPVDAPTGKHDVVVCSEASIESTAALLECISSPPSAKSSKLATVYSYPDAPKQPPSRELFIMGYADASLSLVRKLLHGDASSIPCLRQCTLAVKRGDMARLDPKNQANSQAFGEWMRNLHQKQEMGVVAPDKYGRFALIQATEDTSTEGELQGQDYAAQMHVGDVKEMSSFLTQHAEATTAATTAVETPSSNGLWQPPGAETNENEPSGLWQPPGADEADSNNLWQPPSGFGASVDDTSNAFDWNSEPTAADPWGTSNDKGDGESRQSSSRKRPREEEFHTDSGAAAADKFYSQLNRSLGTRWQSYIYHMRNFNGWVKATQIQELKPPKQTVKMKVLDLACGKGGDLGKWTLHKLENYVGIDVARGSLKDAAIRVRKMREKMNNKCTFTCADLGSDVPGRLKSQKHQHLQKLLTWSLQNERNSFTDPEFQLKRGGGISFTDTFSVVSIQFAIHYMMSTKQRARRFFRTVSELLELGGNLIATTIDARIVIEHLMNLGLNLHEAKDPAVIKVGDGACRIQFTPEILKRIFHARNTSKDSNDDLFGLEYTFTLLDGTNNEAGVGDAVNLPEWLTPVPVLTSLAQEVGLELEYAQNFHEFFDNRKDPSVNGQCHNSLYKMNVLNRHGSISQPEWEISRLYCAIKFRKVREPDAVFVDDEANAEDDNAEDEEIDPKDKAKFLPMAMMKAKKSVDADVWNTLPSDEKTRLTDIELRKLVKK